MVMLAIVTTGKENDLLILAGACAISAVPTQGCELRARPGLSQMIKPSAGITVTIIVEILVTINLPHQFWSPSADI